MADIKNKNELKRRIELFMDELDYSINKDYCMETMRMMREFIGHASHRLDCADGKIKTLRDKVREYHKLEEQCIKECGCGLREVVLKYQEFLEHMHELAEFWKLEEQGLLLRLPCKVGTYIYIVNRYWIDEGHICGLAECDDVDCACFKVYEDPDTYTMVSFNEFGQTWFLTKEEAEQALKHTENAR